MADTWLSRTSIHMALTELLHAALLFLLDCQYSDPFT